MIGIAKEFSYGFIRLIVSGPDQGYACYILKEQAKKGWANTSDGDWAVYDFVLASAPYTQLEVAEVKLKEGVIDSPLELPRNQPKRTAHVRKPTPSE